MTNIAKPSLLETLAGGVSGLVMGPPGTGKSTLLGSAGQLGPSLLLATKPRERNSWLYRVHGLNTTAELFADSAWLPTLGKYEAVGFVGLLRRLEQLQEDEQYDFVLLDTFTDVGLLAAHEILKLYRAGTPGEIEGGSMAFYGSLRHKLSEVTRAITALQYAKRPKHVLVSVHTQPAADEDLKGKATADRRGRHVEYEGDVLAAVEGSYRRQIAGEFDFVCFTFVRHERKLVAGRMEARTVFGVQIAPNVERHAKNSLGPVQASEIVVDAREQNPLREVLAAVERSMYPEVKGRGG